MLTFKKLDCLQFRINVYLDKKLVGCIRKVNQPLIGYRYVPKDKAIHEGGDIFPTVEKCKESLDICD